MIAATALRRLLARDLVRAGALTYAFSALTLVANLATGIVVARALGPGGRGVTVALSAVAQLTGFLVAMGAAQSLSYFIARSPGDGGRLFSTWALMLVVPTLLGITTAELLLPVIFPEGGEAVDVGRWFVLTIVLVVGLELTSGILLGVHDALAFNVMRLVQPVLVAVAYLALWAVGALTVALALLVATAATTVVLAGGVARAVRAVGVARPDLRLGRMSLWYGIRGHGVMIAANVNARLDVAMLPAFVSVASVGLYSVATNVSLIVFQLTSTFAAIVLPAAARDPERAPEKVLGSLHATIAIAGALAIVLGLLAAPLLGLVYGPGFRGAASALQLLLPGAVLFAGSSILSAGLYSAGRPFTATLAQLAGMVVTVAGLLTLLPAGGGVEAAALISSASYATVFVASLLAYKAAAEVPWGWFVPTPARLRALVG